MKFYKKILLKTLSFTIMFLLSPMVVSAQNTPYGALHIFMAADIAPQIKKAITDQTSYLSQALGFEPVIHQAARVENDDKTLKSVLSLSSGRLLLVVDRASRAQQWQETLASVGQNDQRLIYTLGHFLESLLNPSPIDAQIGIKPLAIIGLAAGVSSGKNILCLDTIEQQLCPKKSSSFDALITTRQVPADAPKAVQMALAVSAMTQNPEIDTVMISDSRSFEAVSDALKIVNADDTVIVFDYHLNLINQVKQANRAEQTFAIDMQWNLQASLGLMSLHLASTHQQYVTGNIEIIPILRQLSDF